MFRRLIPTIALASFLTSCNAPPPDTRAADEAAIREADEQWSKAAVDRNLDAVVSYYTDDARLLAPNAPVATDKAGIRAGWAAMLVPEMRLSWKPVKVEVARSGDLAYLTGTYLLEMKPANDTGKMVEVWKKQTDGKWKCVADAFNSDLPAAAAAPPADKKK